MHNLAIFFGLLFQLIALLLASVCGLMAYDPSLNSDARAGTIKLGLGIMLIFWATSIIPLV